MFLFMLMNVIGVVRPVMDRPMINVRVVPQIPINTGVFASVF